MYFDDRKVERVDGFNVKDLLAKSQGQLLLAHSLAVGVLSFAIAKQLGFSDDIQYACLKSGLLHDIGKISDSVQNYLKEPEENKDNTDFYLHTEIGYSILSSVLSPISLDAYIAYWHHARSYNNHGRTDDFEIKTSKVFSDEKDIINKARLFLEQLKQSVECYGLDFSLEGFKFSGKRGPDYNMPEFKKYSKLNPISKIKKNVFDGRINELKEEVAMNAFHSVARTIVVTSDRLISALTSLELNSYIQNKTIESLAKNVVLEAAKSLKDEIESCLIEFDKPENEFRNLEQSKVAKSLSEIKNHVAVLQGPAGVGKTKVALEWLTLQKGIKKAIWICPRKQVCDGIFDELANQYIPNARLEILTGDRSEIVVNGKLQSTDDDNLFTGDLIVTTIDQVASVLVTHRHIDRLTTVLSSTLIIDEFHELQSTKGLLLMLAELLEMKAILFQNNETQADVLLMSATINPALLEWVLDIDCSSDNNHVVSFGTFNQKPYIVEIISSSISEISTEEKTILIFNTATQAAKSHMKLGNDKSILYHSRFTPEHKQQIMAEVMHGFGKNSDAYNGRVLRAGPIVQASLNISANSVYTEICDPESMIQRLGRCNRFGDADSARFVIDESFSKITNKVLESQFAHKRTNAWLNFLKEKHSSVGLPVLLNDYYSLYREFYLLALDESNENVRTACMHDIYEALRQATIVMCDDDFAPVKSKEKDDKCENIKLKSFSMRGGTSYYATMAIMDDDKLIDEYIDPIPIDYQDIKGYDDDSSPLTFFEVNHQKIVKKCDCFETSYASVIAKVKKAKNMIFLAKSPEYPVYVSYTSQHLNAIQDYPEDSQQIVYFIKNGKPLGFFKKNLGVN